MGGLRARLVENCVGGEQILKRLGDHSILAGIRALNKQVQTMIDKAKRTLCIVCRF